ncbi:MAG: SDR family NAD(P)-dependent oxidoreductase [Solirubrobacterales bacterium]|nr:SDR family NAD(P)-dependent oxidoreductase [Solirubrobacterales bacterium]MBV9797487.1 SDR family NAD(P)-dependent oxidoreductase [Solirubrobacterales bacterium]
MGASRVWFITGASSGFGRELANAALGRGDRVVAGARDAGRLADLATDDRVHAISLDVVDGAARERAVQEALGRFGRIDVLVNNAGRTQVGAVEETTEEELRSLFELHFFAPAALTRLVLPHMRAQGGGAIVQMSSVGGQITAPGFGAYCATKFALEGLTQALRDEVAPFGIRTLIVEPGAFRTGLFRPSAAYQSRAMPEYADTVGPTREYVGGNDGLQPGDPAKAAQAILTALDAEDPPLRLVLGEDAIDSIRSRLDQLTGELLEWEEVGRRTAIDGPDPL